jgi:hypothetical protein
MNEPLAVVFVLLTDTNTSDTQLSSSLEDSVRSLTRDLYVPSFTLRMYTSTALILIMSLTTSTTGHRHGNTSLIPDSVHDTLERRSPLKATATLTFMLIIFKVVLHSLLLLIIATSTFMRSEQISIDSYPYLYHTEEHPYHSKE